MQIAEERAVPPGEREERHRLEQLHQLCQKQDEELQAVKQENQRLKEKLEGYETTLKSSQQALEARYGFHNIVGKSPKMQEVFSLLEKVADSNIPVLIYGKSGTGKELAAKAIHYHSSRRDGPLISENCGAIIESLLESELFGHVKGAFTGADRSQKGLFEIANGGTLFLDEIGEMSLNMQTKLLRVLQENKVRPLGSTQAIDINVRLIAATNKDLYQLVKENKFREDLYYRLNVFTIELPPLSERKEDIPLLVEYFLDKFAQKTGKEIKKISPHALDVLCRYSWPGNVRELENEISRLMVFADQEIRVDHLSPHIREEVGLEDGFMSAGLVEYDLKQARHEFEKQFIIRQLKRFQCNVSKTSKKLGITRQHLHRLIEFYKIPIQKLRNRSQ